MCIALHFCMLYLLGWTALTQPFPCCICTDIAIWVTFAYDIAYLSLSLWRRLLGIAVFGCMLLRKVMMTCVFSCCIRSATFLSQHLCTTVFLHAWESLDHAVMLFYLSPACLASFTCLHVTDWNLCFAVLHLNKWSVWTHPCVCTKYLHENLLVVKYSLII